MGRVVGCRSSLPSPNARIPQESHFLRARAAKLKRRSASETPPSDQQGDDSLEDALKQATQLLDEVQMQVGGRTKPSMSGKTLSTALNSAEKAEVTLQCDVSGCTIVPVIDAEDMSVAAVSGTVLDAFHSEKDESDVELLQGKGWRLGVDRCLEAKGHKNDDTHCAVVGGDDWSISLSQEEYNDFIHLLQSLRQGVATLEVCGDWGAEGSGASLEMSTPRVWMQGQASQKRLTLLSRLWSRKSLDEEDLPNVAFSLRFIFHTDGCREAEGNWSADAVMQVLKALDAQASLNPSSQTGRPPTDSVLSDPAV